VLQSIYSCQNMGCEGVIFRPGKASPVATAEAYVRQRLRGQALKCDPALYRAASHFNA